MAAALRCVARKVFCGRALERPQAVCSALVSRAVAVEDEPRRLLPRIIRGVMPPTSHRLFFSSSASDPTSNNKHRSPSCKKFIASEESGINDPDSLSLEMQIEEKKEELFGLLLKRPSGKECAQIYRELLRLLSKPHELKLVEYERARNTKLRNWSLFVASLVVAQLMYFKG